MAREYAQINVSIWQDEDFRALPALAKQLYLDMWLHPGLSYCGVVDWRPGRFAGLHPDLSTDDIQALADCLEARLFIVVDKETEEALIRSWVRFDGLLRQPRLAVSYANAYAATISTPIRRVIVHEAQKLHRLQPELVGWTKQQVQDMLALPALDPRTRALPTDPFAQGFRQGLGQTLPDVSVPVSVPPTTATTTATYLPGVPSGVADADDDAGAKKPRRKPERPLPASWKPNARHHEMATEKRVDIAASVTAFRNHAETHDRRARDWDAAFRTWLNKTIAPTTTTPGTSFWDRKVTHD